MTSPAPESGSAAAASGPALAGISVVLPAHNEAANIRRQVESVLAVFGSITSDLEVIVVDDGSRDDTGDIVRALARACPAVRLVEHPSNRGYGAALHSGFTAAAKPWVFMTDSDCQFDLAEIQRFLPHVAQHDLVIGYRAPRRDPLHRRMYGWGWNWLVRLMLGSPARDVDCAFKLFRREILDQIAIQSRGATFSAEFIVRAVGAGYRIRQVPVRHLPRLAGHPTGGRFDVIARAFRELVAVRVALWRETRQPRREPRT